MRKSFRENYPFLRRVVEVSALWGMVVFSAVSVCVPGVFAVEPSGSAKSAPSLRVGFVPPPFEGTISLGVYDKTGKRIRTLRSEAQAADFTVALNGFVVHWDGKDDAGKIVPPGKYRFSGYAVGDLGVTGEAYHGNDWVTGEDAPHLSAFQRLVFRREGGKSFLELVGTEAGGAVWRVSHPRGDDPESEWGEPRYERLEKAPDGGRGPVSCVVKGGGRWSIEKVLGETLVVQFDAQGEVVRRLSVGAGEPVPVAVAAPEEGEEVFLLEQDAAGTRVRLRGLRRRSAPDAGGESGLQGSAAGRPVWETFFERNRWPSEQFEAARARLGRPKPFVPEKKIRVRLQPNPLLGDALVTVELGVSCGVEGSYLCTADGLPLRKLTETAGLLWAVVGSEGKASEITLIQSDGAVVEEYRIAEPSLMMSFDAGEYVWPPK
jgi:hypothetical protein